MPDPNLPTLSELEAMEKIFAEREVDGSLCCVFCGDDYSTFSSRGDYEDVGFCWTCGTEKAIELFGVLPALLADLRAAREAMERVVNGTTDNGSRDYLLAALAAQRLKDGDGPSRTQTGDNIP